MSVDCSIYVDFWPVLISFGQSDHQSCCCCVCVYIILIIVVVLDTSYSYTNWIKNTDIVERHICIYQNFHQKVRSFSLHFFLARERISCRTILRTEFLCADRFVLFLCRCFSFVYLFCIEHFERSSISLFWNQKTVIILWKLYRIGNDDKSNVVSIRIKKKIVSIRSCFLSTHESHFKSVELVFCVKPITKSKTIRIVRELFGSCFIQFSFFFYFLFSIIF